MTSTGYASRAWRAEPDDPWFAAFRRYCWRMRDNTRALEWSPKISDGSVQSLRFLHTALLGSFTAARASLDELLTELGGEVVGRASAGLSLGRLRSLAADLGTGLAVGYGRDDRHGGRREVKLYVTTTAVDALRPLLAEFLPPGGLPPVGTPKLMVAAAVDQGGGLVPRVYYLWRREDLNEAPAKAWLERWCGHQEQRLVQASTSRTFSVSFKGDGRDMLYLSAPLTTPDVARVVRAAVASLSRPRPALADLRWIGFSKRGEGLGRGELNLYFPAG